MIENGAPHLSDEWLSAHLDAEDSGSEDIEGERHLGSCESCRARMEALRAAKLLVSTPVGSASVESRSRAISAALTAFGDESPKETEPGDAEGGATIPHGTAESRGRWHRRQQVFLGAAAAVIVALAVALPLALTGNGASTTSAARPQHRNAIGGIAASTGQGGVGSNAAAGASTGGVGGVGATPSLIRDLGTVTSKNELISRVRAMGVPYPGAPAAASPSNPDASGAEGSASELSPYSPVPANCVTQTQDETGAHYGPGVVATVTYDGQRAIVMELWKSASPPAAGEDQVAVVTQANCKLLLTATF